MNDRGQVLPKGGRGLAFVLVDEARRDSGFANLLVRLTFIFTCV